MFRLLRKLNFSWFKTFYVNFKLLPFGQAIKLPIILCRGVELVCLDGKVRLDCEVKTGLIRFKRNCSINLSGTIVFKGKAYFGERTGFYIGKGATMTVGNNFLINSSGGINCLKKITFGDNCLISWDVHILDTDFHKIYQGNSMINSDQEIVIGDDVWIGFRTIIMKGTQVGSKIIIGSDSLLNKSYLESNSIYAGNPARLVKEGVTWAY